MSSILNRIDYAARKTLEVHDEFNMSNNFKGFVAYNFDPCFFTSMDGARELIKNIKTEDFVIEMIKFAFEAGKLYETVMENTDDYRNITELCLPCYKFYKRSINNTINPYIYLLTHRIELADIAGAFGMLRYHTNGLYNNLVERFNINVDYDFSRIFKSKRKVKNLKFNRKNINKCLKELESGRQLELSTSSYSLDGKMFAYSDIGFVKDTQEDAVLITKHPANDNYRLIAVADGVGGCEYGGEASLFTLRNLSYWFNTLDVRELDEPDELNPLLCTQVSNINNLLFKKYGGNASCTLTLALVANGKTLVLSVGDSRCYIYSEGLLKQITTDDSLVFKRYISGEVNKDDLRFEDDNNIITRTIGGSSRSSIYSVKSVMDYDLLLLFTDGVTDILSDSDIKLLCDNVPSDQLAKMIVESSKYSNIKKEITLDDGSLYEKEIHGGKDNTTAAVFVGRG